MLACFLSKLLVMTNMRLLPNMVTPPHDADSPPSGSNQDSGARIVQLRSPGSGTHGLPLNITHLPRDDAHISQLANTHAPGIAPIPSTPASA
jgi:hypothetical protein